MKLFSLLIASLLAISAYAWTKEDHEIFDLVSALEAAEGKGTTFYSHVGVDSSATTSEITKAYRKKSLALHPDKNPGVKNIEERFARLGVIAQILRAPESRERYNFFYKNGVPKWRGTGYYYSRFRPTLLHVLIFLTLLTSLFHLLVLKLNYTKDQKRVSYFERAAKVSAGTGKDGKVRRRKVKIPMVEGYEGSQSLELIVDGDRVFLPHDDGSLTPLSDLAAKPSILKTWPFQLLQLIRTKADPYLPAALKPSTKQTTSEETIELEDDDDSSDISTPTPAPRTSAKLAQLRAKKNGRESGASGNGTGTEVETEDDGVVEGGEGEKKKKSKGGKAEAMRRRKMGAKR